MGKIFGAIREEQVREKKQIENIFCCSNNRCCFRSREEREFYELMGGERMPDLVAKEMARQRAEARAEARSVVVKQPNDD